jgi:hypothetical protein
VYTVPVTSLDASQNQRKKDQTQSHASLRKTAEKRCSKKHFEAQSLSFRML